MAAPIFGTLINSLNIFVDTSRDTGKGDDANIQLSHNKISCTDGQVLKLALCEFNMYNNLYTVNNNNAKFRLTTNHNSGTPVELQIPHQNYATVGAIINAFGTAIGDRIAADEGNISVTSVVSTPAETITPAGTSDKIARITITFSGAHNLSSCLLQCFTTVSDSFALLGGDRIDDPTSTQSSFAIDFSTTNKLVITGLYPAQRSTETHVYLRSDVISNNIETASLSHASGPYNAHTLSSNILAKIPIGVEFINFTQSGPHDEFFVNLTQRSLSSLRLFLTDSRGRPLSRFMNSTSQTAAGSGTAQSTKGNLFFSATLRLDVVQRQAPHYLETPPIPRAIPGRFTGPLLNQNFGAPKI